jgi:uncharacterized C2H2 Zn-finger protein
MNKYKIIIIISVLIFTLLSCNKKNKTDEVIILKDRDTLTHFQRAMKFYDNQDYRKSKEFFRLIKDNDSNYAEAQKYIKKIAKIQNDLDNKSDNEISRLKKKYDKLVSNDYVFNIENKLYKNGFKQIKTEIKKAPDGSEQPAMYYEKYEDSFTISIVIQYGYGTNHYFSKVEVNQNE